jgi:hypothetical protein
MKLLIMQFFSYYLSLHLLATILKLKVRQFESEMCVNLVQNLERSIVSRGNKLYYIQHC